jgi:alpha-mannosidase
MNGMFGCADRDQIQPYNPSRYFQLHTADIVIPYMLACHLYWDYWVLTDCVRELGGWEEKQALTISTEILNTLSLGRSDEFLFQRNLKIEVPPGLDGFGDLARVGCSYCFRSTV